MGTEMVDIIDPAKVPEIAEIGEHAAAELIIQLTKTLKEAVEISGFRNAVTVCNQMVPVFTEDLKKHNSRIIDAKRTTMKYRNPSNKPDWSELKALEYFTKKARKGVPASQLVQRIPTRSGFYYRYYKPLYMKPQCLNCHGEKITAGISTKLGELYPNDQATGYAEGDFRGVIRVSISAHGDSKKSNLDDLKP